MAARIDLGAGGEVVAELESLVAANPLRERLWAALMTALYRAGRQADALAAYSRVRRHLADTLGVEPSTELQVLQQQVLQHDLHLESALWRRRVHREMCRRLSRRSSVGLPTSPRWSLLWRRTAW